MKKFVYGSLGACAVGSTVYVGVSEQRRRRVSRGVRFWSKALPKYLRYRYEEWRVKDLPEEEQREAFSRLHRVYAPLALQDILELRGLYIKLGQIMTTRADYAPPEYLKCFMTLQDAVPARPFAEIRELVRRELQVSSLDEVFLEIEELPLGAATIGQVHGARMLNGDRVVLKVQYDDVEELFREDLTTVKQFCALLQPEMSPMLDEMERQFMTEFDFTREGWALEKIGQGVHSEFRGVRIPRPYRELCTKRVCVMERFDGVKLVDGIMAYYKRLAREKGMDLETFLRSMETQGKEEKNNRRRHNSIIPLSWKLSAYRGWVWMSSVTFNAVAASFNYTLGWILPNVTYAETALPVNHVQVIDKLLDVHGYEIFKLGTFNGDAHPGNIFLMPDQTLGLIDYGQVKSLTPRQRRQIAKLIMALCENNSERIVEEFKNMGFETEKNDPWIIERTARFFFEDDTDEALLRRKDGSLMNLQQVMEYLNRTDKTKEFPEYAFLVIRTAMLLRGLASHLGMGVNVAHVWKPYAEYALRETQWIEKIDQLRMAHVKHE